MTPRLLPVAILITLSGCCIPPLPRFLPPGQLCLGLGPIYRPHPGFAAGPGFGPGPAIGPYTAPHSAYHQPPAGPPHTPAFAAPQPFHYNTAATQDSGPLMFGRRWRTRPPGHADSAQGIQPVAWHPDHSGQRLPRHPQRALKHRTAIEADHGCHCEHCERRRRAARNCGCERCRRNRATRQQAGRHSVQPVYTYSDSGQPYYDGIYDTSCSDCAAFSDCSECSGSGCISDGQVISGHPIQDSWSTDGAGSDCNCQTHSPGTTFYPSLGSEIDGLPVDATQPDLSPIPQQHQQHQQPTVPMPRPLPEPTPAPPAIEAPLEEPQPMPEPQPTAAAGIPISEWANLPVEALSMNKLSARKATSIRQISYEMVAPFEAEETRVETGEIPGQRVMLKTIQ